MTPEFHSLALVYATYIIAAGSPGPSNMRIMATAMSAGRRDALFLSAGVLTGAVFWGFMAATGLAALLSRFAGAVAVLKVVCGLYLLFLAYKAARAAAAHDAVAGSATPIARREPALALYRRGLFLHLTNTKSILGWIALMTLGLGPEATWRTIAAILAGCAVLGAAIFGTYAIVFSSGPMVRGYRRARRWIEGALAGFFAFAGVTLLSARG
jgi:threonine/homoserine/homoserine lactone efflux protein